MITLLIYLLIGAAILGIAWYALTVIPMPQPFRTVIIVVICIIAILFLASLLPSLHLGAIPKGD